MGCCAVLMVVPVVFVLHKVYEDGFFGRCGLLGISFTSATFLLEWWSGEEYQMLPQTVALVLAFTVFICWHLIRFHIRIVLARRAQEGQVERRRFPKDWPCRAR